MSKNYSHYQQKAGTPLPLGATRQTTGVNFAIFSRHASAVWLVLDCPLPDGRQERLELALDRPENRTGDIWHIHLAHLPKDFRYGYRMAGAQEVVVSGHCYHPETVLIDPYCQQLLPRQWGEPASYGKAPCCQIANHDFDWRGDRPLQIPLNATVIYELHPRGYTRGHAAGVRAPGSYRGLIEKIPYLQSLGITAIELMPVTEFDETDIPFHHPETGERLKNFWGYNPVSFFALKSGYAWDTTNCLNEFKEMVYAMHQAGIEVLLDMVFNHSGEGGYQGITSSFRGIDNTVYYLLDTGQHQYLNFSGCGNTLNCNHPVVRALIRDALRYWVMEMHVDGFRFDLASILGRDQNGQVLANPPMVELIAEDPILRNTKIIAEAWDAAGLYQVGSFSTNRRWAEWNGRFRDDLRLFMAGHGTVSHLATRLAGSSDLYQASQRSPLSSINLITSHDGFTLADLVSYQHKYNLANGEENRDGDNHNLSWNSGCEGHPCSAAVSELRQRRVKSMLATLLLSQGVPMLVAGDEFGRSQQGNNNAWCQDNQLSWLDWRLAASQANLRRFVQLCIQLRRQQAVFRRRDFFMPASSGESATITWQHLHPGEENWHDDCRALGVLLQNQKTPHQPEVAFFLMFNGSRDQQQRFTPPRCPPAGNAPQCWHLLLDTGAQAPDDFRTPAAPIQLENGCLSVLPLAVAVLQARPAR